MRKLLAAVGAYVAVLVVAAIWRWHLWTYGADTGLFGQAIADAFHGMRDGPEVGSHYRFHWAPMLAILWPFVVVTRSALVLQFAQAIVIGASAIPLYALARTYLDERASFAVAGLMLLYPPLLAVAFTEFHEIAFYPLISLALFWAADRARWRTFAVLCVASALVREEACLVYIVVGATFVIFGMLRAREIPTVVPGARGLLVGSPLEPRRLVAAGLGLIVANACALVFYYGYLAPSLGGWEPAGVFYAYPFASGPSATVVALVTHPANFGAILTFGRLTYLLEAFLPLALLPFFSRWSLLALPGFVVVLLSSNPITWRMGSHYAAIWIPWLFIGVCSVLVRWRREGFERRMRVWPRVAATICVIVLIAFDPLHPAHYLRPGYPANADVRAALASIPPDARVALHDEWFTHIAIDHPYATVFFCPYVDYLVYADNYPNDYFQQQILPEVRAEIASGQARDLHRYGKVAVYERKPDPGAKYGRCMTARPPGFATLRDFLKFDLSRE